MKKTLLLIIILLTGCVSLLAQPVSQREKEEIFTRTKKLFGDAYYFSQTAISTIAFLDKQWKAGKYKPFTTVDDFLAALGADLKNTARDNHLNFFHVPALEAANKASEQPAVPWFFFNDKFSNNGLTDLRVLPGDIGYLLHAFRLELPHPRTGARLALECEPPLVLRSFGNSEL